MEWAQPGLGRGGDSSSEIQGEVKGSPCSLAPEGRGDRADGDGLFPAADGEPKIQYRDQLLELPSEGRWQPQGILSELLTGRLKSQLFDR